MPFVSKYFINNGDKFGSWIVISANQKKSKSMVKCVCDLEKLVRNSDLMTGRSKSCGKRTCFTRFVDLTNLRFGYLIVNSMLPKRYTNGSVIWRCKCVCGNFHSVPTKHLTAGSVKSCGCMKYKLRIDTIKLLSPLELVTNNVFDSYKRGAKARNLIFNLNKDQFQKLIFNNCHYCGKEYDKTFSFYRVHDCEPVYYIGVDRKNPNLGYIETNCVSCCWICNRAKLNSSYEEFMEWITNLILFKTGNSKI